MEFSLPEPIVLATPEEVAKIAKNSELTQFSSVYKFRKNLAVIRSVTELDPVYFNDNATIRERAMFIWGLENMMRGNGLQSYYFNVLADDESWQSAVKHWKAEQVSVAPELRFKKVISNV